MIIKLENGIEINIPNDSPTAQAIMAAVFQVNISPPPRPAVSPGAIVKKVKSTPAVVQTRKRFTDEEQKNIIEMANRKISVKEIAQKMGRSKNSMEQYIYKLKAKGLINPVDKTGDRDEINF